MYADVAWVLVFSGIQVQPQIIIVPDYLPGYPSVSYDYNIDEKLPDYIILKNVMILITCIIKVDAKFYAQIFLEEALFNQ